MLYHLLSSSYHSIRKYPREQYIYLGWHVTYSPWTHCHHRFTLGVWISMPALVPQCACIVSEQDTLKRNLPIEHRSIAPTSVVLSVAAGTRRSAISGVLRTHS